MKNTGAASWNNTIGPGNRIERTGLKVRLRIEALKWPLHSIENSTKKAAIPIEIVSKCPYYFSELSAHCGWCG